MKGQDGWEAGEFYDLLKHYLECLIADEGKPKMQIPSYKYILHQAIANSP